MMYWIQQRIDVSRYEDIEDRRVASLLRLFLGLSLGANFAAYIGFAISTGSPYMPIFAISTVMILIKLVLLQHGYLNIVKWGFFALSWGYIFYEVTVTNGIYSNLYFWFFFNVFFAGIVLGKWSYFVLVGIFVLQTFMFMVLASNNTIPAPTENVNSPSIYAVNYIFFAIFASVILFVTRRTLRDTLNMMLQSEKRFRSVVQDQTEYISRFKPNGDFTFVNQAYCDAIGIPYDSTALNYNLFALLPDNGARLKLVLDKITPESPVITVVFPRQLDDEKIVWEEWTNHGIYDNEGHLVEVQGVGRDITAKKELQERESQLKLMAEREAFLQEFVSSMSHDLQTPLSVIRTSLYLMGRATDVETMHSRISVLNQQTDLLESMIGDILAISRLEYIPELEKEPISIRDLINDTAQPLKTKAFARQIQFNVSLPIAPITMLACEDELHRALVNLIDNAINYTPEGGSVTVSLAEIDSALCIKVKDTGIGIPADALPQVFDRFYRAKNAEKMRTGTGIGLAIVKKIVELHDGEISVMSNENEGTTFTIVLPLAETAAPQTQTA